jgi:FHA domain-containing protein
MPTCPKGHDSTAADYCDECGAPIAGSNGTAAAATSGGAAAAGASDGGTTGGGDGGAQTAVSAPDAPAACPVCGAPRTGRFCESDGYDFVAAELGGGAQPAPTPDGPSSVAPVGAVDEPRVLDGDAPATGAAWRAVASADKAYFGRMQALAGPDADGVTFPPFCPERRFPLVGKQFLIGRRSRSRGIEPQIDLTGPPEDPGVSHAHAILLAQDGGGWAVVDLDSANGTYLNDSEDPIESNLPVPVSAGDRIHVGAWTTLTLQED